MKLLLFQVTLLVLSGVARLEILDHRFFLWNIIEKYGHNGSIPYNGFEKLYKNLGLGDFTLEVDENNNFNSTNTNNTGKSLNRSERDLPESTTDVECTSEEELAQLVVEHQEVSVEGMLDRERDEQQCLSPRQLLVVYGLKQDALSAISFLHLCPAIIYQLDQGTCQSKTLHAHHSATSNATYKSWLYACLTVLVISVSGLLCVAIVPLLQNAFFKDLINFLVALAVGTLLGDAFLHLIPHALANHRKLDEEQSHKDSLIKTGLIFLTVIFFFMFEAVLNIIRSQKVDQNEQKFNYVTVNTKENEQEMMEVPRERSHQHTHSHGQGGGGNSNTAMMVILGDGLHNLTDGLAIGAAFSGGLAPGFATAVAVFTHELPHELGDFAVLIQSGLSVNKALFYNMVSSVLSFLGTVFGLVIGNFGDSTLWIYAITAGSFIYIALSNLIPEINRQKSSCTSMLLSVSGMLCGGILMGSIAYYEHDIQHLFS